jgi:hypothetical protein
MLLAFVKLGIMSTAVLTKPVSYKHVTGDQF